jgi:hypothetical protein
MVSYLNTVHIGQSFQIRGDKPLDRNENPMFKTSSIESLFDRSVSFFLVSLGVILAGATAVTGA